MLMITIGDLVAVVGLCFTIFSIGYKLGYAVGRNTKK